MIGKKSEGDYYEFKEIGKESENLTIEQIAKTIINNRKQIDLQLEKEITIRYLKTRKRRVFKCNIYFFLFRN